MLGCEFGEPKGKGVARAAGKQVSPPILSQGKRCKWLLSRHSTNTAHYRIQGVRSTASMPTKRNLVKICNNVSAVQG